MKNVLNRAETPRLVIFFGKARMPDTIIRKEIHMQRSTLHSECMHGMGDFVGLMREGKN